jgi:hypothetical protein
MEVKQAAVVQTTSAKRYLGQFCKHFAHKAPVELAETNTSGRVTFSAGECALTANEAALTLRLTAPSADEMAVLKDVVERHLVRFAFRETLPVIWGG